MRNSWLISFFALLLPACAALDATGIRGASSMTIDVEVYKGPLSKTQEVQRAELEAIIGDASRTFFDVSTVATAIAGLLDCPTYKEDIDESERIKELSTAENNNCLALRLIEHDAEEFTSGAQSIFGYSSTACLEEGDKNTSVRDCLDENWLKEAAYFGAGLRGRADHWATQLSMNDISDQRVRRAYADFIHYASEFGNQIVSRSDALLVQGEHARFPCGSSNCKGQPDGLRIAGLLSTGYYLRDSSTTNFINIYDWAEAAPERRFPIGTDLSRADRVRMVQSLINDTYWSNINSVYASGQGDVSMAFIKDDIGNWNLKSFENDPADLLNAYDSLAKASIWSAIELARDGVTGGGMENLLEVAGTAVSGRVPGQATLGAGNLDAFRERLLKHIETRNEQFVTASGQLEKDLGEIDDQIKTNVYAQSLLTAGARADLESKDEEIRSIVTAQREAARCNETLGGGSDTTANADAAEEEPVDRSEICDQLPVDVQPVKACEADTGIPDLVGACEQREKLDQALDELEKGQISPEAACGAEFNPQTNLASLCTKRSDTLKRRATLRTDTIADIGRYVADHKAVVNALQYSSANAND